MSLVGTGINTNSIKDFNMKNYSISTMRVCAVMLAAFLHVSLGYAAACAAGEPACEATYSGGGGATCVSVYQAPSNGAAPTLVNSTLVGSEGQCHNSAPANCCDGNGVSHATNSCQCVCNSSETAEWDYCGY